MFVYCSYNKGNVIFNEGDKPYFYILVHGKCSITVKRGHTSTRIKTLEAVSHFGEIALVEKCRTATVTAASDVTLLVLSASVRKFYERCASIFIARS